MLPLQLVLVARIPLIRERLRALFSSETDFELATLAPTADLVQDILGAAPDVLLLDVQVLEQEGWDMLDTLRRALPALAMLILGDSPQDTRVPRALQLGARGYLLRDASFQEMADAVRAAHSGTVVLHPRFAAALLDELRRAQDNSRAAGDDSGDSAELVEPLSERELDVLRLMTRGLSNKQIGAQLYITEHTVKFHIRAILGKLGAANRTEAVTLALQKGLVTL